MVTVPTPAAGRRRRRPGRRPRRRSRPAPRSTQDQRGRAPPPARERPSPHRGGTVRVGGPSGAGSATVGAAASSSPPSSTRSRAARTGRTADAGSGRTSRRVPRLRPGRPPRGSRRAGPAVKPHTTMSATRERRADEARRGGCTRNRLAGSVEVGQRHPRDPRHLARIADGDVARVVPPRHDGHDEAVRRRQEQLLQGGQHADAGRVDAGLLLRLAQRRPDREVVARVDPAAGERRLAGVAAQVGGLLDQQDVGPRRTLAEQDQHRGPAGRRRAPAASGAAAAGRRPRRSAAVLGGQLAADRSQLHPEVLGDERRAARRPSRSGRPGVWTSAPSASRKYGVRQPVEAELGHQLAVAVEGAREA